MTIDNPAWIIEEHDRIGAGTLAEPAHEEGAC
jgi:hypothetical protein